ncbi:MAG TPA: YggS family pyridoxal phosphate-dependent enzyme [Candidatus Omnitrophota bacterium]|nr:YggS family pyridoxal phosphate-dependent enzyme [Candidatus Omnitrophota bacterium]
MISENVQRVKARIDAACRRVNRDPAGVTLVAVTKGRPVEDILQVLDTGVLDIGENRVQEAAKKYEEVCRLAPAPQQVRWHMIGHLQTNKVREAVRIFSLIHSVDSLRLAQEIDRHAAHAGKIQDILLEVKTSPEDTKYGISPEEFTAVASDISRLSHVRLRGAMTMAPRGLSGGLARPYFRIVSRLGQQVVSMGMSDDFEVAIEEGATIVRVGRLLFEA